MTSWDQQLKASKRTKNTSALTIVPSNHASEVILLDWDDDFPIERQNFVSHFDSKKDTSQLLLSSVQSYWQAQLNYRYLWSMYYDSIKLHHGLKHQTDTKVCTFVNLVEFNATKKVVVDLVEDSVSPPDQIDPMVEDNEAIVTKWLDRWISRKKPLKCSVPLEAIEVNSSDDDNAAGSDDEYEKRIKKKRRDRQEKKKSRANRKPKKRRGRNTIDSDDDVLEWSDDDDSLVGCSTDDEELNTRSSKLNRPEGSAVEVQSNVLLLVGPIGSGKTSLVFAAANKLRFDVIEINCSQIRNAAAIKKLFSEAAHSHTINPTNSEGQSTEIGADIAGNIILFEEVYFLIAKYNFIH